MPARNATLVKQRHRVQIFIFKKIRAMTRFFLCVVFVCLLASCNNNTTKAPIENDLAKLENEWMQAMKQRDRITLDKLMAPEFKLSDMAYIDSVAVSKGMWMQNTMQDLSVDTVAVVKTNVHTVDDVSVVKAVIYWRGSYDDTPFADSTPVVDTWVKGDKGWQVISRVQTK